MASFIGFQEEYRALYAMNGIAKLFYPGTAATGGSDVQQPEYNPPVHDKETREWQGEKRNIRLMCKGVI